MRQISFIVFIVFYCCLGIHQTTAQSAVIKGTITDNFGALPGAKIDLEGSELNTYTDVNGNYSLTIPIGEQSVNAHFVMYEAQSRTVNLNSGDTLFIDFQLSASFSVDQQVSIGSRAKPKSIIEVALPVDIISQQEISNSAQTELSQILHYLVPSFNSTHQTISDGTDHVDPATLRGLGPDQILVLVNGKRRHSSSLLNVNGTLGRGSVGTDFNAIPVSSVDRIEILRDGAAAQYGSDAIAGVINIILKEKTGAIDVRSQYGANTEGDGATTFTGANLGLPLGKNGFISLTAEYRNRDATNRAGNYTGSIYPVGSPYNATDFFNNSMYDDQKVMEIGNAATRNTALYFNMEVPLYQDVTIYGHGGKNFRQSTSHAFYRFPISETQVIAELLPHGFSPEISTDIADDALTFGVKTTKNKWDLDFSNTSGSNTMDFQIKNTINASLGQASPNVFYAGGFEFNQNTVNLDINRQLDWMKGTNLAFGLELRVDHYAIIAGTESSWIDGGDFIISGNDTIPRAVGSQGFPGFQAENALDKFRTNTSGYIDLESHISDKLLVGAAARIESYSDFGDQVIWKVSTRYKPEEWLSLRAGYATGFRAPSLHQVYFNNVSTQFENGNAVRVGTFNNESPVTKAFNIQPLKPELSQHVNAGLSMRVKSFLTFALDFYYITIDDRIVLSGRFDNGYEGILQPLRVSAAQFFTNAIDTNTKGLDAVLAYKTSSESKTFTASLAANLNKTNLRGGINVPTALTGVESTLFNREEISRVEDIQPNLKLTSLLSYQIGKAKAEMRNTYFGSVKYVHPSDGSSANWVLNENTGNIESRDQLFSSKIITDLSFSYQINNNLLAKIGGHNIFDVYPDKHTHSANINHGNFVYSRRVQQFGVRGAYYFLGLSVSL